MANALRLFGIIATDHQKTDAAVVPDLELIAVRDMTAVVAPAQYSAAEPTGEIIEQHRAVVDAFHAHGPVLPAPVGTIFRSRDTLTRWLDLHHVALTEALGFVEDRAVARVHCVRADGKTSEREAGADIAASAADAFRSLRRQAVAAVPLRSEHLTGIVLSSAFLVEKELWSDFCAQVDEQKKRFGDLVFDVTGPWPPFDFVRMQFGG